MASGVMAFFLGLAVAAYALVGWTVAVTAGTLSHSQAQVFFGLGILGGSALISGLSLLSRAGSGRAGI